MTMLECRVLADGAVVHGIEGVSAWSNLDGIGVQRSQGRR